MEKIRAYYQLTKPGIIYSNVLAAVAGFFLATRTGRVDLRVLVGVILGIGLIIAASCVVNNYIDRHIDKRMERTKKRALVIGTISTRSALIYAVFLGSIGFIILGLMTNLLTVCIGIAAVIFYVVLYGIAKRWSVHGTIVGSIAGALPPVAGYTAITGQIDEAALLLFLIWVFWQMPHFYAIAMYRKSDYAAAKIPVLPVVHGILATRHQIILYIVAFFFTTLFMTTTGYTGIIYFVVMSIVGFGWLVLALRQHLDAARWARQLFFYSLLVMLVLCLMLAIGARIA